MKTDDQVTTTAQCVIKNSLTANHPTRADHSPEFKKTSHVVAIDFGTTYSGFAVGENNEEAEIYVNAWPMASGRNVDKIPTCILFDGKQTFHSFGHDSKYQYAKLQSENKHEDWYFFKHFKMKLREEEGQLLEEKNNWEIFDYTEKKKMKALFVFKGAIEFMKNQAIASIKKTYQFSPGIKNISENTISWLLTVPAIWTEVAKDFMRKSAIEAGLPGKKLTLVYEPEMAAVHSVIKEKKTLPPGKKFLVLDLGGGTIDITVQEVLKKNRMRQLHSAVGDACGAKTVDQQLKTSHVVAIDFGTTYSGFAVGENDEGAKIDVSPWPMAFGRKSDKIPTCILFDENQQFHSFGHDSEDNYAKLQREDKHEDWYFFRHFKMKLWKEESQFLKEKDWKEKDWELFDHTEKKKMRALSVFKGALEFMKNQAINSIKKNYRFRSSNTVNETTISWLLTVPAIWTDVAKYFMRKSAIEAGLPGENLTLVYEPEMAAVYCMIEEKKTLPPGTKFLVLDLGGGTIDITVQEVLKNNSMRQLHCAVGDACGATTVDQQLVSTIEKKYANNIDAFRKEDPQEYVKFLWDIERMKVNNSCTEDQDLEIEVSTKLSKTDKTKTVTISPTKFKGFFAPVLDCIDRLIMDIQKRKNCKKISHLILAGGFSKDVVIQEHIAEKYRSKYTIFAPVNPATVVLEGAVLFGQHNKKSLITERVCKYTYGFAVFHKFDKTHKEEKKVIRGGKTMAKDCFKVVFKTAERVKVGSFKEITICDDFMEDRVDKKKEPIIVTIYSSEEENPKYTDDTSCKKLCEMKMIPPEGGWPDRMTGKVRFEVAGTELTGALYDNSNQRQDQCEFVYLM